MRKCGHPDYLFSNRELMALILPLILEQTLAITVGMADTMMVASVGEAGVSGVSLMDMVNNLIFSVLAALATGGTVVVSQHLGGGRIQDARDASKQVLLTVFSAAVLLALLLLGLGLLIAVLSRQRRLQEQLSALQDQRQAMEELTNVLLDEM